MKILVRLMFLVLIPIIVGIALVVSGYKAGLYVLEIGTPAVLVALVIAGLIMLMKGKLFPKPENGDNLQQAGESDSAEQSENGSETPDNVAENIAPCGETAKTELSQRDKEYAALNDINSSKLYASQIKLAEYEAGQIATATEHASKKGMIAVFAVIGIIIVDVILAVVFAINRIWVGAIVCASVFAATIIISLLTAVIKSKISTNGDVRNAKKIVEGKVKACFMSSMTTTKSVTPTVRVQGVTYRVIIVADGAEYAAYSKEFYETDETVTIAVMNKKNAKIVDNETLEKLNAEKSESSEKSDSAEGDKSGIGTQRLSPRVSHHHHYNRRR